MRLFLKVGLCVLMLAGGASRLSHVYAQTLEGETNAESSVPALEKAPPERSAPHYYPLTWPILSQLYWKMGAYDVSNDTDIDNFLLLNRCDLYRKYYRDDFKWFSVRQKAQESMEVSIKDFPTRLQILQPLKLGRYDMRRGYFPIVNPIKTAVFEAVADQPIECQDLTRQGSVFKYPRQAEITFSSRLDLWNIPVTQEVAKQYNDLYSNYSLYADRPAYYVIKFKVFEANPTPGKNIFRSRKAEIKAVVESIDFYGDQDLKLHLYTLDFRKSNDAFRKGEGLDGGLPSQ